MVKVILSKLWNRDFSGNSGKVIKNSTYQFMTNLISKVCSLIFTIIVARMLLPEMYGLYSLLLSIIIVFSMFSELGIKYVIVRFVAKHEDDLKKYVYYFTKIKLVLIILASISIMVLAKWLANSFYQQPIFMALLVSGLYIFTFQISNYFYSLLQALGKFKAIFKREIIYQICRITLVPFIIYISLKLSLQSEILLMLIILVLILSMCVSLILLYRDIKKVYYTKMTSNMSKVLTKNEKKEVNKFFILASMITISSLLYGQIDRIMLGKFVNIEFVGYYSTAFNLIHSIVSLVGFASIVLLPIFSKLKGRKLEEGFNKTILPILLVSLIGFLGALIFSYHAVLLIYGSEYLPAISVLRILSILILIIPIMNIVSTYFISQNKWRGLIILTFGVGILDVVFNLIVIYILIPYGDYIVMFGIAIVTVICKLVYLVGLIWLKYANRNAT